MSLNSYVVKTTGSTINLKNAVRVPDQNTSRQEWLAIHTIDFYNQLILLRGCISDFCTVDSCPLMMAGPRFEYLWADGKAIIKPMKVPAPTYIDYLIAWINGQLEDPNIFPPPDKPFIDHFESVVKNIFKRMFRFYAHVYHNHLKQLAIEKEDIHLNTCFKHFILFVREFDLVDHREFQPLSTIISQIFDRM